MNYCLFLINSEDNLDVNISCKSDEIKNTSSIDIQIISDPFLQYYLYYIYYIENMSNVYSIIYAVL